MKEKGRVDGGKVGGGTGRRWESINAPKEPGSGLWAGLREKVHSVTKLRLFSIWGIFRKNTCSHLFWWIPSLFSQCWSHDDLLPLFYLSCWLYLYSWCKPNKPLSPTSCFLVGVFEHQQKDKWASIQICSHVSTLHSGVFITAKMYSHLSCLSIENA